MRASQKTQLATPKYRVRKKSGQKKIDSPTHVAASEVTVLGKVESKGESSSDRGETPSKKAKKTSHKSPLKKKSSKSSDFQSDLQTLDDKWPERFSRLEALFLSKSFSVPVEPVKNSDGSGSSQTSKVWVKVPVDEWLCRKFEKLNITLQEGYPTRNTETAGLSKDQFMVWHA